MSLRARSLTEVKTPRENHVTLDLRKPDLDLVKPAGIGRSVMNSDGGVLSKKCKDLLGLVRTEVVGNDVDLTLGGLTVEDLCQEIDKLLTGMPSGGFS
jgi:hypothetical protein